MNSAFTPAETPVVLEEKQSQTPAPAPSAAKAGIIKTNAQPVGKDFKVHITKPNKDSPIGLELDTVGGVCGMVTSIVDGCIKSYNDSSAAATKVQPGDFIMGVNASSGNTAEMARLASENLKLDLHFRRPAEYTVVLDKSGHIQGGTLGLELEYTGIGKSLLISQIVEGLAMEWNRTHNDCKVEASDRIVAVNNYRGEASKLLELCSKAGALELRILRLAVEY